MQAQEQDTSQRNSLCVYHRIQYSTIALGLAYHNVVNVGLTKIKNEPKKLIMFLGFMKVILQLATLFTIWPSFPNHVD
jgi:hypothetical protein